MIYIPPTYLYVVFEVLGYGSKPSKQEQIKAALEIVEESIEEKRQKGWSDEPITMRFKEKDITHLTIYPDTGMIDIEILGKGLIRRHITQLNLAETYEVYNYLHRKLTGKTLFRSEPAHPELAEIVDISSVQAAKKAVRKLLELARRSPRDYRVAIKRAMILAMNRARAFLNNPNVSPREKGEMRDVAEVYEDAARRIIIRR